MFVGVEKPMKVYTVDNLLFTHAKVPDDVVYRLIETMEANQADMIAVAPNLREFSAAGLYKQYDFPYHPGAVKYFKDKKIEAKATQGTKSDGLRKQRCLRPPHPRNDCLRARRSSPLPHRRSPSS